MLKSAFIHLSPAAKFITLVLLLVGFLILASVLSIAMLIPFTGREIIHEIAVPDYSNPLIVNSLKAIQIASTLLGLMLPALLYLWLCTTGVSSSTGMHSKLPWLLAVAGILLMVVAQPVIGWTNELNSRLVLPGWLSTVENWMKDAEAKGKLVTDAFLATNSIGGLLVNILMIAIIPAFTEEVLFRGALLGLLKEWSKNTHVAVIVSAFVFSAIHLQFYGFLPRFLLGVCLGYMFVWSGTIWLPVLAHFTNNILSVMAEFLFQRNIIHTNADELASAAGWPVVAGSFFLIIFLMLVLYRQQKQLPADTVIPQ